MKLAFALHHSNIENRFGLVDGGTEFGHRLLEPVVQMRARLEELGFEVLTHRQTQLEHADIAVFWDLNESLWHQALSIPAGIPCILVSTESPLFAPLSHDHHVVFSKRWAAVLTWNRSFQAKHIHYYDIPITGATPAEIAAVITVHELEYRTKGVTVCSNKRGPRGLLSVRAQLCGQLAKQGDIDVYGAGWPCDPTKGLYGPTPNKLATMSRYRYCLVMENSIQPGYVSEKLADSILAGIPAIYHGDFHTAERRFPGTFIPLSELTVPCFLKARERLFTDYERLRERVIASLRQSSQWKDSFLSTFIEVISALQASSR